MENFILIISLLIIGMLLKRSGAFPNNTSQVLNQFVFYVSLPALVLVTIPKIDFTSDLIVTAVIPWVLLLFSVVLLVICANIFKWNRNTLGALLLIVPLGNTSFLGIPMVQTFFGDDLVVYALMYDQLGSFLALALYGSMVLAIFNNKNNQKFSFGKNAIKMVISFPPFISLVIALLLKNISLPHFYFELLSPIAMTLVPVVMIAVGFQLTFRLKASDIYPFIIGLSIKMVLAPALAILIFVIFGLNGTVYQVIVFEAAMPPMITACALAIMANLSPKLTAAVMAYGIVLSFVTLPLLYSLLKMIF